MSREIKRVGTLSYERCAELLSECLNKRNGLAPVHRRIGPNTELWMEMDPVAYCVAFYSRRILKFYKDGKVAMWCNGFRSRITKSRLSAMSPYYVCQMDYVWYAMLKDGGWFGPAHEFKDGMTLDPKADLEVAREHEFRVKLLSDKASGADDLSHLL